MANMNLNLKGAVSIAMGYMRSLDDVIPARDLRLEEVVQNDSGRWFITLSFLQPGTFDERDYKILEVDPATLQVVAMRIRERQLVDGGTF